MRFLFVRVIMQIDDGEYFLTGVYKHGFMLLQSIMERERLFGLRFKTPGYLSSQSFTTICNG